MQPICFDLSYPEWLSLLFFRMVIMRLTLTKQQKRLFCFFHYILFRVQRKSALCQYSGKLYRVCTSLKAILTTLKFLFRWITMRLMKVLLWSEFTKKNFTCQPDKLKIEFTNLVIKSSSPEGSCPETTFFARCLIYFDGTWTFECLSTTLLLWNMRQISQMKLIK